MSNKKDMRLTCPICKKEYKKKGWYRLHCLNKHVGYVPPIQKEVLRENTIKDIFSRLDQLETTIDQLVKNPSYIKIKGIERIRPKGKILSKKKGFTPLELGMKELSLRLKKIEKTLDDHLVKPSEFLKSRLTKKEFDANKLILKEPS
jgi:hypothetical protein